MDSQLQMIVMAVKAIYDPTVSNENRIAASRVIIYYKYIYKKY